MIMESHGYINNYQRFYVTNSTKEDKNPSPVGLIPILADG